jgi:CheY-like chemotaxis protein
MRILVVDDEPAVRNLIDRLLSTVGQNVVLAPSAGEASALVLDSWQPFEAAVLDIGLTDMNGVEFAQLLVRLFPRIKVVFITGRRDGSPLDAVPGSTVLGKPFTLWTLLAALGIDAAIGGCDLRLSSERSTGGGLDRR